VTTKSAVVREQRTLRVWALSCLIVSVEEYISLSIQLFKY